MPDLDTDSSAAVIGDGVRWLHAGARAHREVADDLRSWVSSGRYLPGIDFPGVDDPIDEAARHDAFADNLIRAMRVLQRQGAAPCSG